MRILWNLINFSLFGFECEMGMMHTYICMIQFLFRFVSIRSWIWLITKWNCLKCYTIHFIFYHYYSCRIICYKLRHISNILHFGHLFISLGNYKSLWYLMIFSIHYALGIFYEVWYINKINLVHVQVVILWIN